MDYRTGKCSQCGAEYKVPASFAHSAARCKQCKGVVHLGPPQGGAPSEPAAAAESSPAPTAMPARKVVPKPAAPAAAPHAEAPKAAPSAPPAAPKAEPAAEEKKGGTLERLKAQRAAGAGTPAPAPAPAPKPAAAPAARAPAPAAKAPAPAPATKAAAPAPKPAAPAAARAGRKEKDEDDSASKRGGRRGAKERPEKKKSPAGLLSVIGLVVVGAAVFLFRDKLFAGDPPVEGEGSVNAAATTEAGATPAPTADAAAEPTAPAAEPEAPAESPVAREEAAPAPGEKKPDPKVKDPSSIDLAAIADFGPTPDTSAEEWTKLQESVVQMLDTEAGAAGTRARRFLIEQKRKAVPALLNAFKKLDFATAEGRKAGDLCQTTLKDIWNGTNFDWRYPDEAAGKPVTDPGDVWFCKRSTELWCTLWKQAEENIEVWIQKAKLEEKDPEEAQRLRATFGKAPEAGASESSGGDEDMDVD